ncbi:hypothetical protein [Pseudoalteromonas sp. SG41-6]|nr:hypothetical protein [Pseudoalteromonas sp. SG41-6]
MQFALQSNRASWEPTYEIKVAGLDVLKNYSAKLSKKFGFNVILPSATLQRLAAQSRLSIGSYTQLPSYKTLTQN